MELNEFEKSLIRSMAKNDMNSSRVSREIYMHRNTVCYHLDAIEKKTGLSPRKFYDLIELLEIANRDMAH